MNHLLIFSTVFSFFYLAANGERFLLVSHQFGSHMLINNFVAKELPKRGHEVYVALGTSVKELPAMKTMGFKVLRFNHPGKKEEILDIDKSMETLFDLGLKSEEVYEKPTLFAHRECELIMEDTNFINEVKKLQFDLMIVDLFFFGYCLEMLPYSLGVPFVSVSPSVIEFVMRTPQPASFVPSLVLELKGEMTFSQRLKNVLFGAAMSIPIMNPFVAMKNTTLLKKYIKSPEIQNWSDLPMRSSLYFVCSGPIAEPAAPSMPNVINLEGISASPSAPLSTEFVEVVNSASYGLVIVSFGSSVRNLPIEILQRFLDGFSKRKETFLWRIKMKEDSGLVIPENVKIYEWLPQNDLLGDPNIKLFITHSGNNGRYEAIYQGVPMLAFPMFGDQPHNALMIQEKGFGIAMKLTTFTSQELVTNMGKILDSNVYHSTIKKASNILRSEPVNAQQKAANWMEHILKFGSSHLRNEPAMNMPFYKYAMWDIYGFILIVIFIVILVMLMIIRKIHSILFGNVNKAKRE